MIDIDSVAKAICNAHCGDIEAWEITYSKGQDHWRHVARVAIDALQLTEEWHSGESVTPKLQLALGKFIPVRKTDSFPIRRLVGPWVRIEDTNESQV